jgi:hypothetical protein
MGEKYSSDEKRFQVGKLVKDSFELVFRLNICSYGDGYAGNWIGLQDVFTISLDKKGKLFDCVIKISREHNYDIDRPLRSLFKRKVIGSSEVSFSIDLLEVGKVVEKILGEISKLYDKVKTATSEEAGKVSAGINNIEKIRKEYQEKILKDTLSIKEKRDKWKEKLLSDFDIDGVNDLVVSEFGDEFDDVETRVYDEGGGVYYEIQISNFIRSGDKYKLGLEIRKVCSDFIKRYSAAYGDDYDMDVDVSASVVYIKFFLGEYLDSDKISSDRRNVRFNPITGEVELRGSEDVGGEEEEDEYEEDEDVDDDYWLDDEE